MSDALLERLISEVATLRNRVASLEAQERPAVGRQPVSTANVSNPPTDAELDGAFGTPGAVGAGFVALVNDNGGGANVYLVASDGTSWWQAALTKAV